MSQHRNRRKPGPNMRPARKPVKAGRDSPAGRQRADTDEPTLWSRLTRSQWLIAIAAPLITAAAFGIYHVASSRITASFAPLISAYVSYDTSRTYTWSMSYDHRLEPQQVPADVKTCGGMRQWLLAAGGADTSATDIRLHLVGTGDSTVTISGVHAQILSRLPTSPTTLVDCPSAGEVATPAVALDLGQDEPEAMEVKAPPSGTLPAGSLSGRLGASFFATHTIILTKGEPFDISITGFTAGTQSVRWRVMVDYEINGQQHSIPATGPTFMTAPLLCGKAYGQYFEWAWYTRPEHLVQTTQNSPSCAANTLPY